MSDIKLKPCPFCGGDAELRESTPSTARFNEGAVHFIAWCGGLNCEVMPKPNTWHITPEDAARAWNNRPETERLEAALKKLQTELGEQDFKIMSLKADKAELVEVLEYVIQVFDDSWLSDSSWECMTDVKNSVGKHKEQNNGN